MAIDYVGAIKIFAGNFAPRGYALAQGQTMSIQQNAALFSLLGTYYGGNGVSNFQLPDLRSRLPIGQGQGNGLSPRAIGEIGGVENVSLLSANVPQHNHVFNASTTPATTNVAGSTVLLGAAAGTATFYLPASAPSAAVVPLNNQAIAAAGGSLPHNNIQPSMGINYIIALNGVFPPRG